MANWYRELSRKPLTDGELGVPEAIISRREIDVRAARNHARVQVALNALLHSVLEQHSRLVFEAEEAFNEREDLKEEAAFNVGFEMGLAFRSADEDAASAVQSIVLAAIEQTNAQPATRVRALTGALGALIEGLASDQRSDGSCRRR